jgi:hypothetical protein
MYRCQVNPLVLVPLESPVDRCKSGMVDRISLLSTNAMAVLEDGLVASKVGARVDGVWQVALNR